MVYIYDTFDTSRTTDLSLTFLKGNRLQKHNGPHDLSRWSLDATPLAVKGEKNPGVLRHVCRRN